MRRFVLVAIALLLALAPAPALAANNEGRGVILRVRGDVVIPAGESVGSVVVIDGNLRVDGMVKDLALVVRGNAVVNGTVEGDVSAISGDIELTSQAHVHNVTSVRGDYVRRDGAVVTGKVRERDNVQVPWVAAGLFGIVFWVALTIALVVAALVFALVGGRQLTGAARVMTGDAVNTILGIVFVWVALPLIAVLVMLSVIGLPLGIGMLVFLLPVLWFLGYIVAGTRFGMLITGLTGQNVSPHPLLAAAIGVFVLQLVVLVPVIGAIIGVLAGVWGAGALAYLAFTAAGGKGFSSSTPATATTPPPAAPAP